jgi:hypothetical protein
MQRPYAHYLPREFFAEYTPPTRSTRDVSAAAIELRYLLEELLLRACVEISPPRPDRLWYKGMC